jgi:biofilm protein TabA
MIVDKIKNLDSYKGLSKRLDEGLKIISDPGLVNKEDGKYEVDGDNLFYMVARYKTKDLSEAKFETHKRYIDIQAVLKGKEIIGYTHMDNLKSNVPYTDDIEFFETPGDYEEVKMTEGMFSVLFPQDGHMPGCDYNGKNDIVKVVVKVKI